MRLRWGGAGEREAVWWWWWWKGERRVLRRGGAGGGGGGDGREGLSEGPTEAKVWVVLYLKGVSEGGGEGVGSTLAMYSAASRLLCGQSVRSMRLARGRGGEG